MTRDWMAVGARLRQAAALMRERAEAAESAMPGPWQVSDDVLYQLLWTDGDGELRTVFDCHTCGYAPLAPPKFRGGYGCAGTVEEVAHHLASWPPSMAVAVAALLDDAASRVEKHRDARGDAVEHALMVARTYLHMTATPVAAR